MGAFTLGKGLCWCFKCPTQAKKINKLISRVTFFKRIPLFSAFGYALDVINKLQFFLH